jgi:flagellar basal-body rod protein FlgC
MPVKSLFSSLEISASGLTANRRWMDAIAENLANAQTTRTPEGGPYKRKAVTFSEAVKQAGTRRHMPPAEPMTGEIQMDRQNLERGSKTPTGLTGVVASVAEEGGDPRMVYDPEHPDANADGYVAYPDVEVVKEMVDMITASRAYEANVTALNTAKTMAKKALEI